MSELKAGRELDALVAEKVMGWTPVQIDICLNGVAHGEGLPRYSQTIKDAWQVVEKLLGHGYDLEVHYTASNGWSFTFDQPGHFGQSPRNDHDPAYDSVPYLICLAALKAVGCDQDATVPDCSN